MSGQPTIGLYAVSCSRWRRRQPWRSSTLLPAHASVYCRSVLYGIADNQLQRLQSVQNAAARLVTGTRRTEHITPVLQSLSHCTGSGLSTNLQHCLWCISVSLDVHQSTVARPAPVVLACDQLVFWRLMFRRQELNVTDHLPSPAFVTRHCPQEHLQHCWKLTCLINGCGAGVFELAPEKCTVWYDMIIMMSPFFPRSLELPLAVHAAACIWSKLVSFYLRCKCSVLVIIVNTERKKYNENNTWSVKCFNDSKVY